MPIIKFVFFDWGSTLAKPHTRAHFIRNPTLSVLIPGALELLESLKSAGIGLGLVSNMSYSPEAMNKALYDVGLYDYFDVIIYNTSYGLCKKPCSKIFKEAIARSGVDIKNIVMVGNNVSKDILPFLRLGGNAIHVHPKYYQTEVISKNLMIAPSVGDIVF